MPINALQEKRFIGRRADLQQLYRQAAAAEHGDGRSIVLTGPRGIGKTELLKQLYVHLFWKQDVVVPFFYSVNNALLSARHFAQDYLAQFLRQRLAFESKEQSLLYLDGFALRELAAWVSERGIAWAYELLERQQRCDDPVDMVRTALHAPHLSTLVTGKPVLVMIDDFHKLAGLRPSEAPDASLLALFEPLAELRRAPHIITGSSAELQDLQLPDVAAVAVPPLPADEAEQLFLSVLQFRGIQVREVPKNLLGQMAGNPRYLRAVAGAVPAGSEPQEADLWSAYFTEVAGGSIYASYATVMKALFPDMMGRRTALETLQRIYAADRSLSGDPALYGRMAGPVSGDMARSLLRTGLVRGEFGGARASDDRVHRDFVELLYEREIKGTPLLETVRKALDQRRSVHRAGVLLELSLPLVSQAELVVAQNVEQVGKNLHIPEDVTGQLQMAVIEACINAIEHSRGGDKRMHVIISADAEQIEVSVESPGREFVQAETGEPLVGSALAGEGGRGQGLKLMKRFVDSIRYERTERGTRVVLLKRLAPAAVQKKGGASRT